MLLSLIVSNTQYQIRVYKNWVLEPSEFLKMGPCSKAEKLFSEFVHLKQIIINL